MSLYAELLGLRARSHPAPRRAARQLAWAQTDLPLPPVGRVWRGSGAAGLHPQKTGSSTFVDFFVPDKGFDKGPGR